MTLIDADISRCRGVDPHGYCRDCARRQQLDHDDPRRYYPMMAPDTFIRTCPYKICVRPST